MVFVALVCWHGRPWSLLFIDELLSQTGELRESLSHRLPTGTMPFPSGKQVPTPAVPGASLEGSEGSLNLLSWAALQRNHQKTPPGVAITCVQCSSQTKPYSLPLWQQFPQNEINWPNSHIPVESVPSPFPFPHLCSLLYTPVINHVVGVWLSESLCKWMQIIHSKKPHFLFLGHQETGLTGSRRPWEKTGNKDGAQEIVGAGSECRKRAQDSCLFLGQEWAIWPAQKIMTLTLIHP